MRGWLACISRRVSAQTPRHFAGARPRRASAAIAATALLLAATACVGTIDPAGGDVLGRDRSAWGTSARLSFDLTQVPVRDEGPGAYDTGSEYSYANTHGRWGPVGLEFHLDTMSGDFNAPSGSNFNDADYLLFEGGLGVRGGVLIGERGNVQLRGMLGIGWTTLDLDLNAPGGTRSEDSTRIGFMQAIELGWRPREGIRAYVRGSLFGSIDTIADRIEGGLEFDLAGREIYAFVGYRLWRFEQSDLTIFNVQADVDLRSQGVFAGLGFRL